MLPAENTATRPIPAILPPTIKSATPLPLTQFGRPDVQAIGAEVSALAASDPGAAASRYSSAQGMMTPVEIGELARSVGRSAASPAAFGGLDWPGIPDVPGLPSLPGIPGLPSIPSFPGLPDIDIPNPIDIIKNGIDRIGDGIDALQRGAEALTDKLKSVPHEVADKLADSMRGDKARVLTGPERAAVREAFGNRINLDDVRFVDGPGNSPIARAAFAKGNPAITIGNTVYFKPGEYSSNLAATSDGRRTLVHELTHVVQYREMGYGSFGAKYATDLARAGGDPDKLYDYKSRDTTYATETLEGQAQMVGDYAQIRHSTEARYQEQKADLERRLAGTGIYGL